jgi:hypothetical protein
LVLRSNGKMFLARVKKNAGPPSVWFKCGLSRHSQSLLHSVRYILREAANKRLWDHKHDFKNLVNVFLYLLAFPLIYNFCDFHTVPVPLLRPKFIPLVSLIAILSDLAQKKCHEKKVGP